MKAPPEALLRSLEGRYGIVLQRDKLSALNCPAELVDRVLEVCAEPAAMRPKAREVAVLQHLRSAYAQADQDGEEPLQRETELAILLPAATRRKQWAAWGDAAELGRWQPLGRPFSLIAGMAAAGLFVGLVCWHLAKNHLQPILPESMDLNNLTAMVGAMLTWWILGFITRPARIGFPVGVHTVGDLARYVGKLEPEKFHAWSATEEAAQPTREEIASLVREAVTPHLSDGESDHAGAPFPVDFGWGEDSGDEPS